MAGKRGNEYDLLVLGGGIAGLTAAAHAAQYGLAAALIEGSGIWGGQVATVTSIEAYPTVAETSGAELAATLLEIARGGGVDIIEEPIEALEVAGRQFRVTAGAEPLRARSALIATGAHLRPLPAEGAAALAGRGVSHCASCDGPLFRGEDVVVVGGGDAALQEAALLAAICRSVTLVVRGDLRARRMYVDRVRSCGNLTILWDHVVDAVLGDNMVTGVRLRNLDDGGALVERACQAVFPYLGVVANSAFLPADITRDDGGHIVTDEMFVTSQPGLYAVGAVRAGYSGALVSAAGEAAAAVKIIAARAA